MGYFKLIFGGSGLRPRGSSNPEGGITPSVKRGYVKVSLLVMNKIRSVYELARPYLKVRNGETHVRVALRYAETLLELRGGDREVIFISLILHDTGRSRIPEDVIEKTWGPNADPEYVRLHERESVNIAKEILRDMEIDPERLKEILDIISGHDSRVEPISLNDAIVKDSDKLSRFHRDSFWYIVRKLNLDPKEFLEFLSLKIDSWFILSESKQIARKEIKRLEEEIDNLGR